MKTAIFFIFLCGVVLGAQTPQLELTEKVKALHEEITKKCGTIIETAYGKIQQGTVSKNFDLKRDRNYRIYLVITGDIGTIIPECIISPESLSRRRTNGIVSTQYGDLECYNWLVMTFSNNTSVTINVTKPSNVPTMEIAMVLASAGRSEWEFLQRMSDGNGNVFEIHGDYSIYRNGRKYISKTNYPLHSLCVTKQGTLFMLTVEGYVLRGSGTFLKRSSGRAVWMVVGNNDSIYILCSDGNVYDRSSRLVYRRHNERMAIDLVAENGTVWIITKDGQRIEMYSSNMICE